MDFSDEDQILVKNLYISKIMEQKKLIKEFSNKSWRLWGLNKLSKKPQETDMTAVRQNGSTESIQNISCFSIAYYSYINWHYYKGIGHLFANFLNCNATKYC